MEEYKTTDINKKQLAKEALLNTISNVMFLFCLWLMTMLVPVLSKGDFESSGVFTLALSVATIATSIATYNITAFVASDINNKYEDNHYFFFGLTASLLSMVVSVILCFIYGYTGEVFWAIIFYSIFKMFDNFSVITRLIYHRHGRLVTFSYLLIVRSILSLATFAITFYLTKSLFISMAFLAVFGAAYFLVEFLFLKKKNPGFYFTSKKDYVISLSIFYHALPVFLYGMCYAAVVAVPRMVFENVSQNKELLGYFGIMSSITTLIPSVTSALILPFIPKITDSFQKGDKKSLLSYMGVIFGIIFGITLVAFLMVLFLGDWALNLVYGKSILEYSSIFKWLVLASGLQSIVVFFSDSLVALRKFKYLIAVSLTAATLLFSLMYVYISNFSIWGMLYTYLTCFGAVIVLSIVFFSIMISKLQKNNPDDSGVIENQ